MRYILFILLTISLVACGSTAPDETESPDPEPTNTPVAESDANTDTTTDTETSDTADDSTTVVYDYDLTEDFVFDMPWGGQASVPYSSEWRVSINRDDRVMYIPDSYNISVTANNDPTNDADDATRLLDRLNQSAEIEQVERDGQIIYHTRTRGGNALAVATMLDDVSVLLMELVNTRGGDLDLMLDTLLEMADTSQVVTE